MQYPSIHISPAGLKLGALRSFATMATINSIVSSNSSIKLIDMITTIRSLSFFHHVNDYTKKKFNDIILLINTEKLNGILTQEEQNDGHINNEYSKDVVIPTNILINQENSKSNIPITTTTSYRIHYNGPSFKIIKLIQTSRNYHSNNYMNFKINHNQINGLDMINKNHYSINSKSLLKHFNNKIQNENDDKYTQINKTESIINMKYLLNLFSSFNNSNNLDSKTSSNSNSSNNNIDNKKLDSNQSNNKNDNNNNNQNVEIDIKHDKAHVGLIVSERFLAPKDPIVLCHGLFGFDVVGPQSFPALQLHYWKGIKEALESIGCQVHISKVGTVDSLMVRAKQMVTTLNEKYPEGQKLNFIGHSMGGLDARYLISHLKESRNFDVNALISVATPHRGSSFMDWCREALGVGYILEEDLNIKLSFIEERNNKNRPGDSSSSSPPNSSSPSSSSSSSLSRRGLDNISYYSSNKNKTNIKEKSYNEKNSRNNILSKALHFTGMYSPSQKTDRQHLAENVVGNGFVFLISPLLRSICSSFDSPAFCNLTREYCTRFNELTPNDPNVTYMSYAAITELSPMSLLYFSHEIVQHLEGPNDGLVALDSAKWGEFMGTVECDHWQLVPPRLRSGPSSSALEILAQQQKMIQQRLKNKEHQTNSTYMKRIIAEARYLEYRFKSIEKGMIESAERTAAKMSTNKEGKFDSIGFYLRLATALAERGF